MNIIIARVPVLSGAEEFLWLPYTLLLLFIQPLRRVSHLRPLNWINKFAPVYGTMLLVQGIFLVILTATLTTSPELNNIILVLSLPMNFLFFFILVKNVYRDELLLEF